MCLVSVIIPALNEEEGIVRTLLSVEAQRETHEIIVADGGSDDDTRSLAASHARVVESSRGRARQMNTGAASARGDVLLFLHADTLLPDDALSIVRQTIENGAEGGVFRLAFDRWSPLLRLYSFCTRLPIPRLCFGDRAIFVRRDVFENLGGYPDVPLFEDLELVRMLHDRGAFVFLDEAVTTSARRFELYGPLRQQLRNTYLWLHYVAGTDPRKLAHLYRYDE